MRIASLDGGLRGGEGVLSSGDPNEATIAAAATTTAAAEPG